MCWWVPPGWAWCRIFAETLLGGLLARFAQLNPDTQLQVRVGGSAELLDMMQSDAMDVLLCMGRQDDPAAVRTMPMQWLGNPDLSHNEVLPLAVLERPCRFRDAALSALDHAGRPHRIVLETPSLAALRAAVESGLGITCRTTHFIDQAIEDNLPALPDVAYMRHIRSNPHPTNVFLGDPILQGGVGVVTKKNGRSEERPSSGRKNAPKGNTLIVRCRLRDQ